MNRETDKILMCPPDYFTVDYVINPWMAGNEGGMSLDLAKEQWCKLRDGIAEYAEVVEIAPQPELPDMVFTANAGVVYGDKAIASHFMPLERRPEEPHFKAWFTDNGFDLLALDEKIGSGELQKIHDASDLLCRDLEFPPSLFELAGKVGLSHTRLNRGFRQVFETTVFGYLRRKRLDQAKWLMEEQSKNVTEAAFSVGYRSLSSFSRAFQSQFGMNPIQCLGKKRSTHHTDSISAKGHQF